MADGSRFCGPGLDRHASLVIGIVLGLIAGYGPRWLDNLMILLFDAMKSFPTVMLALALVTLMGPSLTAVMVVVVLVNVPGYARIIRTQTIALKNLGIRHRRAEHGRVFGPYPAGAHPAKRDRPAGDPRLDGHSRGDRDRGRDEFLGLGVRPPTPSWGSILNDGFANIRDTAWIAIAGGCADHHHNARASPSLARRCATCSTPG